MTQIIVFILLIITLSFKSDKKFNSYRDDFTRAETDFNASNTWKAIYYYRLSIQKIKSEKDTLTFKAYCRLAESYYRINALSELDSTFRIIDKLYRNYSQLKKFNYEYVLTYGLYKHSLKDYSGTIFYFNKALNLISPTDTLASFLNYKLGVCFEEKNNIDSAELYYKKALKTAKNKKICFSNELANCYSAMAFIYSTKYSDFYKAKLYCDSVLNVSARCHNLDSIAYAWNLFSIGNFYLYQGLNTKSEKYYNQSLRIYTKLKNCNDELNRLYYYQSYLYSYLGEFEVAHNKIDMVISYYLKSRNFEGLQESYCQKAYIYFKTVEYNEAIKYYKRAFDISENYQLSGSERIMNGVAWSYSKLNMQDSAKNYFKRAAAILNKQKIQNINTFSTLYGEYSRMLIKEGKYGGALETIENRLPYIHRILGEKNSQYGYFIYWKALALEKLNRLFSSLQIYQEVIKASIDPDSLGDIYGIPSFKPVDIISYDNLIDALAGKAEVLAKMSMLPENRARKLYLLEKSLDHYSLAKKVVEIYNKGLETESDRLQYSGSKSDISQLELIAAIRLFHVTGKQKYLKKAFVAADQSKAIQLSFGLKDEEYKRIGGIPDSIISKEKDLFEEMVLLQSSIREEQNKLIPDADHIQELRVQLMNRSDESDMISKYTNDNYPKYDFLKFSESSINVDSLIAITNPVKTLIEYAIAGDSLYTFVLASGKINLLSQPLDGLQDKVIAFRKMVSELNDTSFMPAGKRSYAKKAFWLYERLIKPAERYFAGNEIVVIPDDVLNLLPFETLVTTDNLLIYNDYALFPYLLEKYSISYSFSAGLLQMQQKLPVSNVDRVLAYSPSYKIVSVDQKRIRDKADTIILGYLNSDEEVSSIVKIFGGRTVLGRKATKGDFKKHASEGKIIHLAMHALVDNEYPLNSKLAFSQTGDSGYNGFLNTYEIYNLKLNSPLVVLNACNTGSGKLMKGEGVLSLSRGFIYAGCPSMVITLWNVSDNSSIKLMQLFYKNLKSKNKIDVSLQKAKKEYIKNSDNMFSHPFYWAGFIQTGRTNAFTEVQHHYSFMTLIICLSLIGLVIFIYWKQRANH